MKKRALLTSIFNAVTFKGFLLAFQRILLQCNKMSVSVLVPLLCSDWDSLLLYRDSGAV